MILKQFTTTDTMDKHNQSGEGLSPSPKKGSNMKTFMATYTEDKGKTHHEVLVSAETYTEAYVNASLKTANDGIITDLFEVK